MSEYIDKQAALDMVRGLEERYVNNMPPMIDKVDVCNALDTLTFADVQPVRHGEWQFSPDHAEGICTNCCYKIYGRPYQGHYLIVPYNYCPNCGARMDGEYEAN